MVGTFSFLDHFGSWPVCARCGHQVEHVQCDRDICTDETVITVCCHGETQTVRLTPEDLIAAEAVGFTASFRELQLPESRPEAAHALLQSGGASSDD